MRFQVPQFIETETKIIGPFTLKQFLFLASGVVLVFMLFFIVKLYLLVILGIPIMAISGALAFYKVDGVPLPRYIMMSLSFLTGNKKYIFSKELGRPYLPKEDK